MSKVYYITSRVENNQGLMDKFIELLGRVEIGFLKEKDTVCIKTHFGEDGNTTFISPLYIRKVVDHLKRQGVYPFIGDTNTLYSGRRKQGVTHLELAIEHGFDYSVVKAPLVILDGLQDQYRRTIAVKHKHFREISLAGTLGDMDSMIVMSHFKGHLAVGFGGAIKNLAMGLGTRKQKQLMHADVKPEYVEKKCIKCRICSQICPVSAINWEEDKFLLDLNICIGCAECITNCPTGALRILWNETPDNMSEKLAETALGAVEFLKRKLFYFNFLINITPHCDCFGVSDNAIVEDIGILASSDPVAIDKASFDLVSQSSKLQNSVLQGREGEPFRTMYKDVDPLHQLRYGESIGLGSMTYELEKLSF
ncbi:MAG: DUF362 domain-containing protein [Candidatus Cloacimonetes bacterium]|nr:DUF362 domain-containing protein [Candidatus Cloacimonadota bacterium]